MSLEFGLFYPPWNHTGRPDELLERVAGEVGIDHLTIPAVTGEHTVFRFGQLDETPYFHTDGGWHFPPQVKLYTGSVRPPTARWFGKQDVIARIAERAAALRLSLFFRIHVGAVRRLRDHQHLRRRNAWGQDLSGASPCAYNPELCELLRATLQDLTRYQPAGFELEGWAPRARRAARAPQLTEVCFCAACRQTAARAGVDPDQAARSVRAHLERLTARATPGDPDAAARASRDARVDADEVLAAYEQARAAAHRAWLDGVAREHAGRRCWRVCESAELVQAPAAPDAWEALARITGATSLRPGQRPAGPGAAFERFEAVRGLALPTWGPAITAGAQFVQLVSAARGAGVEFFDFEGLAAAPPVALTWLKQAVRYARRD